MKHEIQEVDEPELLQQDAGLLNFENVQKLLEKNLALLTEAQEEHEIQHDKFNEQFNQMGHISGLMLDIQNLIVQDYNPNEDSMRARN